MADSTDSSVYFTDGHVISKQNIRISAKFNAYSEYDDSLCLYFDGKDWSYHEFEDSITSVWYSESMKTCFWLGRNGEIGIDKNGKLDLEKIPDALRYGHLNRIRQIGSHVYICGYGGQVYMRTNSGWGHIDDGILVERPDASSVDLQDIDGTSENNIYVVGTGGAIFHYNGKRWSKLDSPTNVHLLRVQCINSKNVYISGSRGVFLKGNKEGWRDCSDPELTDIDYWGITKYDGKIYLAHSDGLIVWDGQKLLPVDLGLAKDLSCHRLHSNDGVLWSFGTDDLLYYDGKGWNEVICPENE